jgi:hypothetical protein
MLRNGLVASADMAPFPGREWGGSTIAFLRDRDLNAFPPPSSFYRNRVWFLAWTPAPHVFCYPTPDPDPLTLVTKDMSVCDAEE